MTLFVADVSSAQEGLSMATVKAAGMSAVIIKCTEAGGYINPLFGGWVAEAEGLGMPVAAYHFLHPVAEVSAARQAANIDRADPDPRVPVWMDCEAGATRDDGYAVADALRALGQTVAGIYHGARPRPGYGGWWRAGYLSDPSGPAVDVYRRQGGDGSLLGWVGNDLWQFCQHGTIPGFGGDVDFSAYRGTLAQLTASGWFWTPTTTTEVAMPVPGLVKHGQDILWTDGARFLHVPNMPVVTELAGWTGQDVSKIPPASQGVMDYVSAGMSSPVDVSKLAAAIVAAMPATSGGPTAADIAVATVNLLAQRAAN